MEKAARIKQLVDARTALLEVISGLCDDDFEATFGDCCLSLKERLAHIAAVDWDVAKAIRQVIQGKDELAFQQLSCIDFNEGRASLVEPRCCSPANEVVAEVVLSLQVLLDELRSLPEEHFSARTLVSDRTPHGVASLLDETVRCTQQHCQEIISWRG